MSFRSGLKLTRERADDGLRFLEGLFCAPKQQSIGRECSITAISIHAVSDFLVCGFLKFTPFGAESVLGFAHTYKSG